MSSFSSKKRSRLNLSELDARIVPAAVVTKLDLDGDGAVDDVRIVGDAAADNIVIEDGGDSSQATIKIDNNGDGDFTDATDLNEVFNFSGDTWVVELDLKAGNDNVQYGMTDSMNDGGRTIMAMLGAGNDKFFFSSFGLPITGSSYVSIDVEGRKGKDDVTVETGAIDASAFSVKTDLGKGADNYDLFLGAMDDKSTIDVRTDLGAGANTHAATLLGVGKFQRAFLNMTIASGTGADQVTLNLKDDVGNNTLVSSVDVFVDLGAGNDVFTGNFDNDFKVDNGSRASLILRGGEGDDSLTVGHEGGNAMGLDTDAFLLIDLDGGNGNDTVQASFAQVVGVPAWVLQAGSTLKMRIDGGAGNDTVSMLVSCTGASVGDYDLAARGGAGDDKMGFISQSNGGTPTFGPAQGAILDGGAGIDALQNFTPNVTIDMGIETV